MEKRGEMNMKNSKFDRLVNMKGGIEKLIKEINTLLKDKKLMEIAQDYSLGKSTLVAGLSQAGFKYDRYTNSYIKVIKDELTLSDDIYKFFYMGDFNKPVTFRGDKETIEEFEELAKNSFGSISLSKLYTLAVKEFLEKYK